MKRKKKGPRCPHCRHRQSEHTGGGMNICRRPGCACYTSPRLRKKRNRK